jgi:hypothetical protein
MSMGCAPARGPESVQTNAIPAGATTIMPKLSDLKLDDTTTYIDVVSRWGKPRNFGPGDSIRLYGLDSDEQLWLTFSAQDSGNLMRAVVVGVGPAPKPRVLFDAHPQTKKRRCDQLDFKKTTSAAEVNAAWGPPDNVIGSGIDNWIYQLADGTSAALIFSAGKVINANGCGK